MYIEDINLVDFFWTLLPSEYKNVFNNDRAIFGDVIAHICDIHDALEFDDDVCRYKINYMRDIHVVISFINMDTFEATAIDEYINKEALLKIQ